MRLRCAGLVVLGLMLVLSLTACRDRDAPRKTPNEHRPLRPLVYTEHPDVGAGAVAVREQRLMRQLLEGADRSGTWGDLGSGPQASRALPALDSPDSLGRALFDALMTRNAVLWQHAFVSPLDYARMVYVEPQAAQDFVDAAQAKSINVWESFDIERASEAPQGGLSSVFEYRGVDLGQGRTVDGSTTDDAALVAQHWGNVLRIGLIREDVEFELRLPKVLRVVNSVRNRGRPVFVLAAPVKRDPKLESFVLSGLHLKEKLLETHNYPIPLKVGNFWRYRRRAAEAQGEAADVREAAARPAGLVYRDDEEPGDPRDGLAATESLTEVVSIERIGTRRLVKLRRSYNDARLTIADQHWLVMPRRVYLCTRACRRHFEDLEWLLVYMRRQTPIYVFPTRAGSGWTVGGTEVKRPEATFWARRGAAEAKVPAGHFFQGTYIEGVGPTAEFDRYLRGHEQVRTFVHGRGVVRRELLSEGRYEVPIIEELVEYRLVP